MTESQIVEYIFKGILAIGTGAAVWLIKDFKCEVVKLTESLTDVTISLRELIVKDEHKQGSLTELKAQIKRLEYDVSKLKGSVIELKHNKHKE